MCSMDKCNTSSSIISFFSHSSLPYYKYYGFKKQLHQVKKQEIKDCKWPTIQVGKNVCKYDGCNRAMAAQVLKKFEGQIGVQDVKDMVNGFNTFLSMIKTFGKVERKGKELTSFVTANIVQIVTTAFNLLEGFTLGKLVSFLTSICQIITNKFVAQSYEALAMACASTYFPPSIIEIIKRMHMFSSAKLCDDYALFQDVFNLVYEVFEWLESKYKDHIPVSVSKAIRTVFEWSSKRVLVSEVMKVLKAYNQKPTLVADPFFCDEFNKLYERWKSIQDIDEWIKRSASIKHISEELLSLSKCIFAHNNTTRQEPLFLVFEGPPGCLKSFTMNNVIKELKELVYAHHIKSIMDGKDYYDTYNNEDIFVMDDVGQQGISQYRSFINFVSCVNLKLDCANEKKKDTKFFTSNKIMITTNNFMHLQGLCRSDGIENLEALHRRGYVFDFSLCKNDKGILKGKLMFKYYDLKEKKFINGFPEDLRKFLKTNNLQIDPYCEVDEQSNRVIYIPWFINIIRSLERVKKAQMNQACIGLSESNEIQSRLFFGQIEPELIHISKYSMLNTWDYVKELGSLLKDMLWELLPTLPWQWMGVAGALGLLFGYFYNMYKSPEEPTFYGQLEESLESYMSTEKRPSTIEFLEKQQYVVSMDLVDGKQFNCCGTVSGAFIIIPSHGIAHLRNADTFIANQIGHITLTKYSNSNRVIDHAPAILVRIWEREDVAIIRLPYNIPSHFKSLKKQFTNTVKAPHPWLVTPLGSYNAAYSLSTRSSSTYYHVKELGYKNKLNKGDFMYEIQGKGLCGALLTDQNLGIVGMHVAGNGLAGAAIMWSPQVRQEILNVLCEPYIIMTDVHHVNYDEEDLVTEINEDKNVPSGVSLLSKRHVHVSTKSNLVPSPLADFCEGTREPANMLKYGPDTVKVVAEKSFAPVASIPADELEFMRRGMLAMMSPYKPITDSEVVLGNEWLAGLNKTSSNGFGLEKDKSLYIDFETGEFTPLLSELLIDIYDQCTRLELDLDSVLWTESPKDEIRNLSKEQVPRTFRIAPLPIQVLTKKLTGGLMAQLIKDRWTTKMMIGVNPYSDWDTIYRDLKNHDNVFDGDVGKWDGGMLPQVQHIVADCIMINFEGSKLDRSVLYMLLGNMINTPVLLKNEIRVTTHSMPSGCFWTAMFNSLVNRCYSLGWYYRTVKSFKTPSLTDFNHCVSDYVYGDDKLVGVSNYPQLNAISMAQYFKSIGLDFTDAHKNIINKPYSTLGEVSFLKRDFRYHREIGRVMCPLSYETMSNSLRWIDNKKDVSDVMKDKVNAYQRELYLHERGDADVLLEELFTLCRKKGVIYSKLSADYLKLVYTNDDEMAAIPWHSSMGTKYQ